MKRLFNKGRSLPFLLLVLAAIALPAGTGCGSSVPAESPSPQKPVKINITVAAAGDVLMHLPIVDSAKVTSTGAYDFLPVLAPIRPYLEQADYSLVNLETRLAGSSRGYSGYPRFNSPVSLAYALQRSGVDLLATANNHCLDMGWSGIEATLENIDRVGLAHMGTSRSVAERTEPLLADVKGIKLAFLNYTESTNGIPLPKGRDYAVNMLDMEKIPDDIAAARAAGADLLIAVLHFGNEYQRTPSEGQIKTARMLCKAGFDAIIGAHPHVVQPIENYFFEESGVERRCIIAYSLGNFISNQRQRYRDSGIILYLDIEKDPEGKASVTGASYLPVWVHKAYSGGRNRYRVLPVGRKTKPQSDLPLSDKDRSRMQQVGEELSLHLSGFAAKD